MGPFDNALERLGIKLPATPKPVAAYAPFARSKGGQIICVAGQLPFKDGVLTCVGPVPSAVSIEQAAEAARLCAINAIAALRDACQGDIDKVASILRVGVFVQCDAGFPDQPKVANGASELIGAVFGEQGKHARVAVGTNALPLNATVEVEIIADVRLPMKTGGLPI